MMLKMRLQLRMQRTSVNNVYSVVQTLQLAQLADEMQSVRASSGREDDAEDDLTTL